MRLWQTPSATLLLAAAALAASPAFAGDDAPFGILYKTDPPFAIDGDLGDWADIPNALPYDQAEQVVHGPGAWTSPDDLSGRVRLAWRQSHLYLAAEVVDDQLRQTQQGDGIWKGDHAEVFIDAAPDLEPERDPFGEGQYQFGFSPGNFLDTRDPLTDCRPEVVSFRPRGASCEGVDLAAKRLPNGWTIEAAMPWALIGLQQVNRGTLLRFEVALSDTDSPEPRQESFMTSSTETWGHRRSRLRLAALAGPDGEPPEVARKMAILEEAQIERGQEQSVTFSAAEPPEGRDAILSLNARLQTERVAGHTYALKLTLNGRPLGAERLVNKPRQMRARSGDVYPSGSAGGFRVFYAPDFTSPDQDQHYGLIDGVKACLFELNVTDLLRVGENQLVIANSALPQVTRSLMVGDVALEFRRPPPPERRKAGPPTGPLPTIEPRPEHRTAYSVRELDDGRLEVKVGGDAFVVESRFSTPKPGWMTGSNEYFDHERQLEQTPEAIIVRDRFTNKTNENLALMQRHEAAAEPSFEHVWIAGLEKLDGRGQDSQPSNPTSYGATESTGIGLVATGDVGRVHVTNYALDGRIGLADNQFVLRAGGTYVAEWAIVPTDEPGYWAFTNAARRLMDVNFTIDGAFAFLRAAPQTDAWSDAQIADFIRLKDAKYVCASIMYPLYEGRYPHGTAFQKVSHDNFRNAFERWRKPVPGVQNLVYFHCFLDVTDEAPELYADSRLLRPDGKQGDYGKPEMRLYYPTEENSYGRVIGRNVDIILDDISAEGVYWDEHERSAYDYHYGEPWDGLSGDIDAKTMAVSRLKSSVTLLSESWRANMARRIMDHGPLIGNGPAVTKAMAGLHFPCFVETGSITNCRRAHLYSPIALGDHLTERSERDAYYQMLAALDYGCVYHWYGDLNVIPTHHHLTRYMYPITPLELHEGYIIGEERIVTNRSGLFGWGDASEREVHVFNDEGVEVEDFDAPLVRRDGKTYTELRIAEDWSAAIVRK